MQKMDEYYEKAMIERRREPNRSQIILGLVKGAT